MAVVQSLDMPLEKIHYVEKMDIYSCFLLMNCYFYQIHPLDHSYFLLNVGSVKDNLFRLLKILSLFLFDWFFLLACFSIPLMSLECFFCYRCYSMIIIMKRNTTHDVCDKLLDNKTTHDNTISMMSLRIKTISFKITIRLIMFP